MTNIRLSRRGEPVPAATVRAPALPDLTDPKTRALPFAYLAMAYAAAESTTRRARRADLPEPDPVRAT